MRTGVTCAVLSLLSGQGTYVSHFRWALIEKRLLQKIATYFTIDRHRYRNAYTDQIFVPEGLIFDDDEHNWQIYNSK